MDILFYSRSIEGIARQLLRIALSHVSGERIDQCRCLAELDERLRHPRGERTIALLHAADREELEALAQRRERLADFRVLLSLADHDVGVVNLGHVLKPRFWVFSDEDLAGASVVVGKLLQATARESLPAPG